MEVKKTSVMYGAADEQGRFRIFNTDPRTIHGPLSQAPGQVSVEDTLLELLGPTDKWHPVKLQVGYMILENGREFNPNNMADIRNGTLECHIEDRAKRPVKIIEDFMADSAYPYIGLVYDMQANRVIEIHNYDEHGRCNDGIEEHVLMEKDGKVAGAAGDYENGPSSVREPYVTKNNPPAQPVTTPDHNAAGTQNQERPRTSENGVPNGLGRNPAPITGTLDQGDNDGDGMEFITPKTLGGGVFSEGAEI